MSSMFLRRGMEGRGTLPILLPLHPHRRGFLIRKVARQTAPHGGNTSLFSLSFPSNMLTQGVTRNPFNHHSIMGSPSSPKGSLSRLPFSGMRIAIREETTLGTALRTNNLTMSARAFSGSSRSSNPSQVLGAGVPCFRHFPYRAQQVLQLYKQFLCLIYHHHRPEEQRDLLFRVRQEFTSRRHLKGQKVIARALRRGQGLLEYHRQLLDAKETTRNLVRYQKTSHRNSYLDGGSSYRAAATSVNDAWGRLKVISGNVLPGLELYDCSLPIHESSNAAIGHPSVYSRRRP